VCCVCSVPSRLLSVVSGSMCSEVLVCSVCCFSKNPLGSISTRDCDVSGCGCSVCGCSVDGLCLSVSCLFVCCAPVQPGFASCFCSIRICLFVSSVSCGSSDLEN
jgi:hypothetical protein